ncbi:YdaU family protein [Comamonas odontotermitis]|uniref:YdaU family protein n=1 Tax=Comamonas odontotermitis TaxID=379895 RepID=UPI003670EEE8
MNHYPHHIGDFNNATRHLTFVERALYRELLDLYYDTERPLNADADKLARRVLAHTDEQREALRVVLDEFFFLRDDGWHNSRCDAEIAAYQDKAAKASEAGKKSAEVRRSKAVRKPARKDIPPAGGNTPGGDGGGGTGVDLQQQGPDTDGAAFVERTLNERATNQNQNQNQYEKETSSPKALRADDDVPLQVGEWVQVFGDEFGVEVLATNMQDRKKFWPLASGWVNNRVSVGQMRRACRKARAEAKEGIAYLPAYVDRVLVSQCASDVPVETAWQRSQREAVAAGAPFAAAADPVTGAVLMDGFAFYENATADAAKCLEVV